MKRANIQNEYMFDTKLENIFINEFMIQAPDNFVKIYLVALMYVDLGKSKDDEELAKILGLEIEEIQRAWTYWQNLGVVKYQAGELVFVSLKEEMYGNKQQKRENTSNSMIIDIQQDFGVPHILDNKAVKIMFISIEKTLGRTLNGTETKYIYKWLDEYNIPTEIISFGYNYCVAKKKDNVKYIDKVVKGWNSRGFTTVTQVEKFLEDMDQRYYVYKRIMRALGFGRKPTEEERRIIDTWIDKFDFKMDDILNACAKTASISNPNIKYVNAIITNKYTDKTGKKPDGKASAAQVKKYYEHMRDMAQADLQKHKNEVFAKVPRIKDILEEQKANYLNITNIMIGGDKDKQQKIKNINDQNAKLQKERDALLVQNNIPVDYMELKYNCNICKDTGITDNGQRCSCYTEVANKAANWNA